MLDTNMHTGDAFLTLDCGTPLSYAPHPLKPSTPLESNTPRLRTSMSSHPRLVSDDVQDGCPTFSADIRFAMVKLEAEPGKELDTLSANKGPSLMDMPEEIQQRIIDMLMGELKPTSSSVPERNHASRNWSHAMRHPRGRKLSNLACVCPTWRRLVQERLYRHVKVQGTTRGLQECYTWFFERGWLASYVRHIEFWVPVWEKRVAPPSDDNMYSPPLSDRVNHLIGRNNLNFASTADGLQAMEPINSAYRLSKEKATLQELFFVVSCLFQSACALTVEGGHCKKPPMIQHFRGGESGRFTQLPKIQTLVMRGAWNIAREDNHFYTIVEALPNIKEWHCSFTKPKVRGYQMMHSVLQHFPSTLTHLNICLEGFYGKKAMDVSKVQLLQREHHLCDSLGRIMPQLETLTLTGRACSHIFAHANRAAQKARNPRLKSVDIVVKNCCRDLQCWSDGIGIHNRSFLEAFEKLVTTAVDSLKHHNNLNFIRIRFLDLDTQYPLLNPYFQLQNNDVAGIWNESILETLAQSRPKASYFENPLMEGFNCSLLTRPYVSYPSRRPKCIKISSYAALAVAEGPFF